MKSDHTKSASQFLPITVVSGLPRSGTSMMMRCLETGGLNVLVDGERTADRDNPNGYYEFEAVKTTLQDPSWIDEAGGKVVKMVYRLVRDLPPTHQYRVLVMRRRMPEILASQRKMLERLKKDVGPPDELIARLFEKELKDFQAWSAKQRHLQVTEVFYHDVIEQPRQVFERIAEFLVVPLDIDAMCEMIDPTLYRNRV